MAGQVVMVKFEGGRELEAALLSLRDDMDMSKSTVRNVMKRGLAEAGRQTADAASSMAPDDPSTPAPDLHTSIASGTRLTPRQAKLNKRGDDKSFAEAYVGVTGAANQYAHLVEFGDANQSPQPFMRPGWASTKDQVLGSIRGFLEKQIAKSTKRAQAKALKLK